MFLFSKLGLPAAAMAGGFLTALLLSVLLTSKESSGDRGPLPRGA